MACLYKNVLQPDGVEVLDVMDLLSLLRARFMSLRQNHSCVGVIRSRMKPGRLAICHSSGGPQCFGALLTAIPQ
jgi:hypothetical protein